MATAQKKAAAPRTVTRDEPEARMPDRTPERDPNAILTRDGKPVDLGRIKNKSDDVLNLKAQGIVPDPGWTYEWRTRTIKNAPYTRQIVDDEQTGWTPVPASRHPGRIMPMGHDGPIEYEDLMLMERDDRLTAMSRAHAQREAHAQLNISRSMTGLMQRAVPGVSPDSMNFESGKAQEANFVRVGRTPMGDPNKNYNYQLDE